MAHTRACISLPPRSQWLGKLENVHARRSAPHALARVAELTVAIFLFAQLGLSKSFVLLREEFQQDLALGVVLLGFQKGLEVIYVGPSNELVHVVSPWTNVRYLTVSQADPQRNCWTNRVNAPVAIEQSRFDESF